MADITKIFTATGTSDSFALTDFAKSFYASRFGLYFDTANFIGTVQLERSIDGGVTWYPIYGVGTQFYKWTFTGGALRFSENNEATEAREVWRLNCTAYTSGSLTAILSCSES